MNVMQSLLKKYKRKINKVIKGGGILSILFALMISLFIPPFNIYADTLSMSNIVGINYTISNSMVVGTVTYNNMTYNRYSTDYDVEIKLDDSYLGWCQLTIEYDYYDRDSSGVISKNTNVTRRIYINGDTVHININILNNYGSQPLQILQSNPRVTTITNSNVVPYGDLATLEDILSVLNDVYSHVDDIENKMDLENDILNKIYNSKQWHMPIESFTAVYQLAYSKQSIGINTYNYFDYPIFELVPNDRVFSYWGDEDYYYIFGTDENIYNTTVLNSIFESNNNNLTMTYDSALYTSMGVSFFRIIRIRLHNSGSPATIQVNLKSSSYGKSKIMPIYLGKVNNKRISTDFALQWGLSNQLLDDLHIISSGTTQSNTSSSQLENQKSSFDSTSNNLYSSENAFNTDMNNKLQGIDTSFNPSTSFGSKFLSSANWVRTQFDNLTSTSPFGTVLSFSMLLGLSLLIIGKVFK